MRRLLAILLAALVLAGCGGTETREKKAAEPATAPSPTQKPAGTTFDVGAAAQGIVYDARTDTLAVAVRKPYRLLLVDPTTGAVRRSVTVAGKVRHLQVAGPGGPVLVPSETANRLYQVPLDGGAVTSTEVPRHPHDATGADGTVVVGNEFDGSISVIKDDQVVKTIEDLKQPGGVVAAQIGDQPGVAVVDVGDYTVTTYSLRTLKRLDRVPAGAGPTHGVLATTNRLAVTDTRGGRVLLYSLDPLKQVGSVRPGGSPYGLSADPTSGTVWVTLTARNELVGYRVDGDRLVQVAKYPTVRQPDTVAVAPGAKTLWVTGTDDGVVQRITR